MDEKLARLLVRSLLRSSSDMTSIIPVLKEHCDDAEYQKYGKAIAKISADISLEVLNEVFASHPKIKQEVDLYIEKYGRF